MLDLFDFKSERDVLIKNTSPYNIDNGIKLTYFPSGDLRDLMTSHNLSVLSSSSIEQFGEWSR